MIRIPSDTKKEILELHQDGLNTNAIATYIGVSNTAVKNIIDKKSTRQTQAKYYRKNRKTLLKKMNEYTKKYKLTTITLSKLVKKSLMHHADREGMTIMDFMAALANRLDQGKDIRDDAWRMASNKFN